MPLQARAQRPFPASRRWCRDLLERVGVGALSSTRLGRAPSPTNGRHSGHVNVNDRSADCEISFKTRDFHPFLRLCTSSPPRNRTRSAFKRDRRLPSSRPPNKGSSQPRLQHRHLPAWERTSTSGPDTDDLIPATRRLDKRSAASCSRPETSQPQPQPCKGAHTAPHRRPPGAPKLSPRTSPQALSRRGQQV